METFDLEKDIQVFCIRAASFPDGVLKAHQALHAKVPFTEGRKYFGISRPENGEILYRAAAEELEKGELEQYGFESFVIPKGKYVFRILKDFTKDISSIGRAFDELIHLPGIDPQGYCIEWYMGMNDVRCMVRLK
ncbi:MAG: putative transcription activator [Bacteroidetes bacterium]|jgi:hypothetical protein|nr:putative transcription activator [Bacteroidota bacterium]